MELKVGQKITMYDHRGKSGISEWVGEVVKITDEQDEVILLIHSGYELRISKESKNG